MFLLLRCFYKSMWISIKNGYITLSELSKTVRSFLLLSYCRPTRRSMIIYHIVIYSCIVVGQLSGYSKCLHFVFIFYLTLVPPLYRVYEISMRWNKRLRENKKNNGENSSSRDVIRVGLFMNRSNSMRKLNNWHSGGIRLQFFFFCDMKRLLKSVRRFVKSPSCT